MATKVYACTSINGGASGALDTIPYATLLDGDYACVTDSNEDTIWLRYESSSATAESSPWTTNKVVKPDDAGANNGRWVLVDMVVDDLTVLGAFTQTSVALDPSTLSDHGVRGITYELTAGENLVFGDFCYLKSDGKYWKSDADAASTMPITVMAAESISADAAGTFLRMGMARDDTWAWTAGGMLYASTTAGAITHTAPSGSGDQVQRVAQAQTTTRIDFFPSLDVITLV